MAWNVKEVLKYHKDGDHSELVNYEIRLGQLVVATTEDGDAAHKIVTAVNSHDALVAALAQATDTLSRSADVIEHTLGLGINGRDEAERLRRAADEIRAALTHAGEEK